jgi:hypothetical protein
MHDRVKSSMQMITSRAFAVCRSVRRIIILDLSFFSSDEENSEFLEPQPSIEFCINIDASHIVDQMLIL